MILIPFLPVATVFFITVVELTDLFRQNASLSGLFTILLVITSLFLMGIEALKKGELSWLSLFVYAFTSVLNYTFAFQVGASGTLLFALVFFGILLGFLVWGIAPLLEQPKN